MIVMEIEVMILGVRMDEKRVCEKDVSRGMKGATALGRREFRVALGDPTFQTINTDIIGRDKNGCATGFSRSNWFFYLSEH